MSECDESHQNDGDDLCARCGEDLNAPGAINVGRVTVMELAAIFHKCPDVVAPTIARLQVDPATTMRNLGFDYRTSSLTESQAQVLAGYAKGIFRRLRLA